MMRGRSRRFAVAAVASAALATTLLLGAVPAHAGSDGSLEFSSDGSRWSPTPPVALYGDGIALVPGTAATSTVWVRNATADPGILVAAITDITASSADAARGFGVTTADSSGAGLARTEVGALTNCAHVVPTRVLGAGASVPITMTVDLSAAVTGDEAQNDHVSFALRVGLTDAAAGAGGVSGCPAVSVEIPSEAEAEAEAEPESSTALPTTGGRFGFTVLVGGLLAGGLGWSLLFLARRSRQRRRA